MPATSAGMTTEVCAILRPAIHVAVFSETTRRRHPDAIRRHHGELDHVVPLTAAVLAIIGEKPKDAKAQPFLFSTDGGKRAFSGYSKAKRALDKKIFRIRKNEGRDPMPRWTLSRDVRRTSKTLMARSSS
jgi:hypothetical protein